MGPGSALGHLRGETYSSGMPVSVRLAEGHVPSSGVTKATGVDLVDLSVEIPSTYASCYRRQQSLLSTPSWLQQELRKVGALPYLRHRQLDRPDSRVPVALSVPVAAMDSLQRAAPVAGAVHRMHEIAHAGKRIEINRAPDLNGDPKEVLTWVR